MKNSLALLAFLLFALGFVAPALWVPALIIGFVAIGMRPEGLRADGRSKTGGLLGWIWDDLVVAIWRVRRSRYGGLNPRLFDKPNQNRWSLKNSSDPSDQGAEHRARKDVGTQPVSVVHAVFVITIGLIIGMGISTYLILAPPQPKSTSDVVSNTANQAGTKNARPLDQEIKQRAKKGLIQGLREEPDSTLANAYSSNITTIPQTSSPSLERAAKCPETNEN